MTQELLKVSNVIFMQSILNLDEQVSAEPELYVNLPGDYLKVERLVQ